MEPGHRGWRVSILGRIGSGLDMSWVFVPVTIVVNLRLETILIDPQIGPIDTKLSFVAK